MGKPGFHCITFGCQMNVNDSQWVERALMRLGFEEKPLEEADVVFLNTCSVREKPEQKVYSALGRVQRANPRAVVGVAGCVAQQLGEELMRRHPQVRLVAGSDGVASVPGAFVRLLNEPKLKLSFLDFTDVFPDRDPCLVDAAGRPEQDGVTPVAYVNIMQGCDNFCAYCIVPYTRGPRKSRSTKAVLDECRAWVARGAGVFLNHAPTAEIYTLALRGALPICPPQVRQVAAIPGLRRIRFVSAHPRDFSQETIDMFAELPQLCPRLHLPLQSGSDSMLKKMGRGYDMERYLSVVEALRKARPDIALSTDLIVGFPSETEEEFEDTLKAIDSCGFMSSFSFCYSDRPGTRASAMPFKIPHEVQLERLDRLQSLQNERAEAWLRTRVGLETDVLLEGPSHRQEEGGNEWQGRDPWGDMVNVSMPEGEGRPGQFVDVKIDKALKHSLKASPVR